VGEAIHRFHAAGGWHADLNANNLLLTAETVVIIDLDRGRCDCTNPSKQHRNLNRLVRSLHKLGLMPAAAEGWRALLAAYVACDSR